MRHTRPRLKVKAHSRGVDGPQVRSGDADLRRRILEGAVQLIEQGGLATLSMREVARAAGVSHQAPYHWFEDRPAILAAIADEGFLMLAELLRAARRAAATPPARMAAAGEAYVRFAWEHPAHFRVMFRADFVDMDRFEKPRASADIAFAALPELVRECIEVGFDPAPSEAVQVVLAWSICHGLACLLLDGPLAKKLPEVAEARDALTRDTMAAMRLMIESRIGVKPRPKARAKGAATTTKRGVSGRR